MSDSQQSTTLFDYASNDSIDDSNSEESGPDKDTQSKPPNTCDEGSENNDPICSCYLSEKEKWCDQIDDLNFIEIQCGHAIDYIADSIDATISRGTARVYKGSLRLYIEFLHEQEKSVCDATLRDIDRYFRLRARNDRRRKTLRLDRSAITNLYKHITLYRDAEPEVRWDLIREEINPSAYQTPEPIERKYLEKEEIEKLYNSMNSFRDKLMVQVGIELGPRNTDICSIKLENVDLDAKEIELTNTKANNRYSLPITDELALLLRRWIETERSGHNHSESEYLFPSLTGDRLDQGTFTEIVKNAAKSAGIQEVIGTIEVTDRQKSAFHNVDQMNIHKVTPHTLRHTFNHLLEDAGLPRDARSSALNHGSTTVTKKYYEHDEDDYVNLMRELFTGTE